MVPKHIVLSNQKDTGFRAVLFRMVPKLADFLRFVFACFRAVLFRMVPKQKTQKILEILGFRAVLFRMVPKPTA